MRPTEEGARRKIGVKICGITKLDDALHAATCGAGWIGFVLADSPRRCSLDQAAAISGALAVRYPQVGRVGVFVDPSPEEIHGAAKAARLTHVQIHGALPPRRLDDLPTIRAIPLASAAGARWPSDDGEPDPWAVLVEPKREGLRGGTGRAFPWEWATPLLDRGRVFVAGGLDAAAVAGLLSRFRPFAVDASSRLEREPGVKDPAKVRAFVDAVRIATGARTAP
ncbi:MAG: phosphoribosylanthranilate isomerase [Candidatus Eisenbacteria bacterium]